MEAEDIPPSETWGIVTKVLRSSHGGAIPFLDPEKLPLFLETALRFWLF